MTVDTIRCCDCLEGLRDLPDNSAELCACDPPYAIGFMGREWDGELPGVPIWEEVLRVLKPGASCFVMSGARQDSILGNLLALRKAGFDIEHSALTWVFFTGMPKGTNLSKDADKAAFEAWCKAVPEGEEKSRQELMDWTAGDLRKAASAAVQGEALPATSPGGSIGDTCYNNGQGRWYPQKARTEGKALLSALVSRFGPAPGVREKVGESRRHGGGAAPMPMDRAVGNLPAEEHPATTSPATPEARELDGLYGGAIPMKPASEIVLWATKPQDRKPIRKNVLEHGVGAVDNDACRIPFEEGGVLPEIAKAPVGTGRYPSNLLVTARALGDFSKYGDLDAWAQARGLSADWLDAALEAGVLRVAKPSQAEKNAGCEGIEEKPAKACVRAGVNVDEPRKWIDRQDGKGCVPCNIQPSAPRANSHPTCKPVTLFEFLIALACPEGGVVLEPFAGSGTTCVAAIRTGRHFIAFEREAEFIAIAKGRIAHAQEEVQAEEPQLALEFEVVR